jgi:uncharacterized membrane protein
MGAMIPEKLLHYILYFGIMAFAGWIIEVVYRSCKEKRLVNAGFLSGPVVPIYGFGAVIITAVNTEARSLPPVPAWLITLLSPTALEYAGSWFTERIFGVTLWDYRGERFNVRGRICLRFSVYWACCAALLVLVIQPAVFTRIKALGPYLSHFAAGAFFAYIVADAAHSVRALFNFKAFQADVAALLAKGRQFRPAFGFSEGARGKKPKLPAEIRRVIKPLAAFPSLRKGFRSDLPAFPDWIRNRLEKRLWNDKKKR